MEQDQHNYVTRRKMWILTAEALAFFVLLVLLSWGGLYLTYRHPLARPLAGFWSYREAMSRRHVLFYGLFVRTYSS